MIHASQLRAWALDYAFALRCQAKRFRPGGTERLTDGDRAPVVLIPGVYERWRFLGAIAARLHEGGHPVHVVDELGDMRAPVPQLASVVRRFVERESLRGAVLVCHSKGGLVGKHVMAIDDIEKRVDAVVAIATPFGGSKYARYFPSPTLRDFSPTAATLAMLGERRDVNERITSIYGRFDPHIPEGSTLHGAVNVELPVLGHFRILDDPSVIQAVVEAVDGVSAS